MTKMVATPIYGINTLKIFFTEEDRNTHAEQREKYLYLGTDHLFIWEWGGGGGGAGFLSKIFLVLDMQEKKNSGPIRWK